MRPGRLSHLYYMLFLRLQEQNVADPAALGRAIVALRSMVLGSQLEKVVQHVSVHFVENEQLTQEGRSCVDEYVAILSLISGLRSVVEQT